MARIGVLTMHRVLNYGSILQAYATKRVIESLGHDCEIIDYRYPNEFHYAHGRKKYAITWKGRIARRFSLTKKWRRLNRFRNFQEKYLNLSREYISPEDIRNNPPNYDIYLVGSDQVWNPKYLFEDTVFLLDFVPNDKKKISYASSFSTNKIPEAFKEKYIRLLSQFESISVRETNGAKLVKELTGRDASVNIDPTLLLKPDDWNKICSRSKLCKRPYILVYILTYAVGDIPCLNDIVRKLKQEKNAQIIYLGNRIEGIYCDRYIDNCSPSQFISLVRWTSFIITTSFHGTAFALNYGIPFISIADNKADDRIYSLLQQLDATRHMMYKNDNVSSLFLGEINETIKSNLVMLRNKSVEYLKKCLKEC